MSDNRKVAADLIHRAEDTIMKKRPGVHGSAENSFLMIGELWTTYLRHVRQVRGHDSILPQDVSEMMTLLKKARKVYGDASNDDNDIDDIGYAALAGMLRLPDPDNPNHDGREKKIGEDTARALAESLKDNADA